MLNLAPLVAGQQEYYLGLAKADDYYLGKAEAPGAWIGSGRVHLDLDGLVGDDDLRSLLTLRDPRTGTPLNRAKMPGYDLAFRAPKSVSILYALGERGAVTGEVVAAHDEAVRQAVAYLEAHACAIRYRIDGEVTVVPATGFIGAAFRHRTSRAADPLLHTHVLIANAAQDGSGRWGALDGTLLFRHGLPAGYVYQAVLRSELTRRLGVSWLPVENGVADIAGIPRGLIETFSKRRRAILEALAERGESSARAAQVATLATRQPKDHPLDEEQLRAAWVGEANAFGFSDAQIKRLLAATEADRRNPLIPDRERLFSTLASSDGLTKRRSTFDRRDVIKAVCEAMPDGARLDVIEELTDAFLDHHQVVPLGSQVETAIRRRDGQTVSAVSDRFTTVEMLETEATLMVRATAWAREAVGGVGRDVLARVVAASPVLSEEQRSMVDRVCGHASGLDIVVGVAGSGKTRTLSVARKAWEQAGHPVLGCALAARAAAELQSGSGIPSTTLARLTRRLEHSKLRAGSVLVVDEAAMIGTRTLLELVALAERDRFKLVLVGDHRQLPEMEAGGAFAILAERHRAPELAENHRQRDGWEREALARLRSGDVVLSTNAYWRRGRLTIEATGADAKAASVDEWWRARSSGKRVAMVALRRQDVRDLNDLARARLLAVDAIGRPAVRVGGFEVGVGDEVVGLRNDYELGILNGDTGTVTAIGRQGRWVEVEIERGNRAIRLPRAYVEDGHLDHGYALTIHKAQGATFDRCLVLADDGIYRQAAYTGLSRGRERNAIFAAHDPAEVVAHGPDTAEAPDEWDGVRGVMARLATDRSQTLANSRVDPRTLARVAARLAEVLQPATPSQTVERRGPEHEVRGAEVELPGLDS